MTTQLVWWAKSSGADFSTLASMISGVGTDLTASSTGKTCSANGSANTIVLSASETKDFTGHPITWNGQTQVIGSYNTSTKVATLVSGGMKWAGATLFGTTYPSMTGYTGTWATGTPASGDAYTIADVSVVMVSDGAWNVGTSGPTLTGITVSSTNTITWVSAQAFDSTKALIFDTTQSSSIESTGGSYAGYPFRVLTNYTTVRGMQIWQNNTSSPHFAMSGISQVLDKCLIRSTQTSNEATLDGPGNVGQTLLMTDCVFLCNKNSAGNGWVRASYGTITAIGCTVVYVGGGSLGDAGGYTGGSANKLTATDCAFFGFATASNFIAVDHSVSDLTLPAGTGNVNGASLAACFVGSTTDFRAKSGGTLALAGTPNSNILTDIYGNTRSGTAPTVGAMELVTSAVQRRTLTDTGARVGSRQAA